MMSARLHEVQNTKSVCLQLELHAKDLSDFKHKHKHVLCWSGNLICVHILQKMRTCYFRLY